MRPPIMKARMSCIPAEGVCRLLGLASYAGAIWPSGGFERRCGSPQICKAFACIACAGCTGLRELWRHRCQPRSAAAVGSGPLAWMRFAGPPPSNLHLLLSRRN